MAWRWRRAVSALLIVVLSLAGIGRAMASIAAPADLPPAFRVPICHSGSGGGPADPTAPPHDCCDACALLAPVVLPGAPVVAAPAVISRPAERHRASAWMPRLRRQRGPRQSRGPPAV